MAVCVVAVGSPESPLMVPLFFCYFCVLSFAVFTSSWLDC